MKLVTVKTKDLIGPALDWAVGTALGWITYPTDSAERGSVWHTDPASTPHGPRRLVSGFHPSTSWLDGGPLIPQHRVEIAYFGEQVRACVQVVTKHSDIYTTSAYIPFYGDPAATLVVAMRAVVQKVLGSTVSVPAELLEVTV